MASTSALSAAVYENKLLSTELPQFARPTTPNRSPFKEAHYRRSPAKTLRPVKPTPDYDEFYSLLDSDSTTAAEKELASRVVRAAEKLREWCTEIEQWGWSGSFDIPAGRGRKPAGANLESDSQTNSEPFDAVEFCGSLSRDQVESYEACLDAIDEELSALEVDELKEQILGIHVGRSRPSSSYSSTSISTLILYDDFQLFVTETLIQTLPYHAKLKQYLKAWSTRLAVLVEVPSFLEDSRLLDKMLNQAWYPLQYPVGPLMLGLKVHQLQEDLKKTRDGLKDKVADLGKQLDGMLDTLEGSDDHLPDNWIDRFEANEKEYTDWSYEAEKKLFQLRMLETTLSRNEDASAFIPPGNPHADTAPSIQVTTDQDIQVHLDAAASTSDAEVSQDVLPIGTDIAHDSKVVGIDGNARPVQISQASDATISNEEVNTDEEEHDSTAIHHAVAQVAQESVRRASVTSIESFSRDQVKSVDLSRRNSSSTLASQHRPASRGKASSTSSPIELNRYKVPWAAQSSVLLNPTKEETLASNENPEDFRPQTPTGRERNSALSDKSSPASDDSESKDLSDESPSMRVSVRPTAQLPRPPLNYAMRKRRGTENTAALDPSRTFSAPFSDLETINTSFSPPESPSKNLKSPRSPAVPLDEQISTILESIPAPIRLKSGPSPNAAEVRPRHKQPTSSQQPGQPRSRAPTPALSPLPTFTLAPADDVSAHKAGANDPEIKLYHLSSGKDKPIKLFVRRVGENGERVMVRVGGGWADLGEYLRTYAEHHGRRAASDGKIEVLGLSNDAVASIVTPRSSDSRRASLQSSVGSSAVAGTTASGEPSRSSTSPVPTGRLTPRISDDINTPQTTGSGGSRRSSFWDDGGLMGPAARKAEISEEKKEWVDGIVEQAKRTVSRKVEFGDLGKKGGTRRVFLKGKMNE